MCNRRHVHVVDRGIHAGADCGFGVGQAEEHDAELALGLPQSGTVGLGAGHGARVPDAVAGVGLFFDGGVEVRAVAAEDAA